MALIEQNVLVTTKHGKCPAFAACPDAPGAYPGIIFYMDAPGFREELPYILAVVQLEEGSRLMTNLIDVAPDGVTIGLAVEVVFEDVTPEITLAKFRPA